MIDPDALTEAGRAAAVRLNELAVSLDCEGPMPVSELLERLNTIRGTFEDDLTTWFHRYEAAMQGLLQ